MFSISCKKKNSENPKYIDISSTSKKSLIEAKQESEKTFIFHFSDVSINPVFELHQKTRNEIFSDFSQMKIIIDDKTKFFSIEDNCTFEYVIKKTSAVKYWGSSKTVELYKKELAGKNITLDENNVIVYQSLYPEKECQYPSSEFIKINKTLIFVYQGYLIFFRDNGNENNGVKKNNCIDTPLEMGNKKECLITNINLADVYSRIIEDKIVDNSDYLEKQIPKSSQIFKINDNGLISIKYEIKSEKVKVSMLYDGGLTEIILEKEFNNVRRTIIQNAD